MAALDKLGDLGGPPLIQAPFPDGVPLLEKVGPVGAELTRLLRRRNGFFAFEGALHVFPFGSEEGVLDLATWNTPSTWREAYGGLLDGCLFFGEDAFGHPFCIENQLICSCDAETGSRTVMAPSLEEWAGLMLLDWPNLTGHPLAHTWQAMYGPLLPGQRLAPRTPFVLGGSFSVDNLYAAEQVELMRFRGSLAVELQGLSDGSPVTLKVET